MAELTRKGAPPLRPPRGSAEFRTYSQGCSKTQERHPPPGGLLLPIQGLENRP